MKPYFHFITPIGRVEDMDMVCKSFYESIKQSDIDYTWWWIQFEEEELDKHCKEVQKEDPNIIYVETVKDPEWHDIMKLFNTALKSIEKSDIPGWVWHIQDDNLVSPWAFRRWSKHIKEHKDKHVLVASHDRGDHPTRHPHTPLLATPNNMHVGGVSLEQYLIHTSIHNGVLYANNACGDGIIMENMYAESPAEFAFIPDFYIPFNALEPRRWRPDRLAWFMLWTDTNPRIDI